MRRGRALVAGLALCALATAPVGADDRPPMTEIEPFDPPAPPVPPPATMTPAAATVQIDPGSDIAIDFALTLPARPTPLDVFFLVDTSASQEESVVGLAKGIARISRDLATAGLDAQFGLGEFQDIYGVRYRRRVDIGPPGRKFQREVVRMYTAGGEETHLNALHQVATGSGLAARRPVASVARGQQASWRKGSLRVVILITDEPFLDNMPGPDRDDTVAALRADGARVIGIEVSSRAGVEEADRLGIVLSSAIREDLEDIARGTDALAPAGGVDCTGNGSHELRAGAPLVCTLSEDTDEGMVHLADPLVRLLSSLVDMQPVQLTVGDLRGFTASFTPGADDAAIDVKKPHALAFSGVFGCPAGRQGAAALLPVEAQVGAQTVATSAIQAYCGPRPVTAPPPPRIAAALAPASPTAPAPIPASAPAAAPSTLSAPAAQASPSAQAAAAAAPAPQPQLAAQRAGEEDWSNGGSSEGGTPLNALAAAAAAAAAFELARRSQLARQRQR